MRKRREYRHFTGYVLPTTASVFIRLSCMVPTPNNAQHDHWACTYLHIYYFEIRFAAFCHVATQSIT